VCDVVYALRVEALEREVTTAQFAAVLAANQGAEGVQVPDLDTERAAFDARLAAEPVALTETDRDRLDEMRSLGVVA
jgi:hypothetical protein